METLDTNSQESAIQESQMISIMDIDTIKNQVRNYNYDIRCQELFKRYDYLDTVPGQSIKQILVGLMSIAEVCYKNISGMERMQYTIQTYENYINTKGIQLDSHGKNLLRAFAQQLFDDYKKKLKGYYKQLFELGMTCLKILL